MQGDTNRAAAHIQCLRRLGDRSAADGNGLDHLALNAGQRLQIAVDIEADQVRLVLVGGADADHARGYAYWLVQADSTPRDDVQVVLDWIKTEAQSVELRLEDELKSLLLNADSRSK